MHIVRDLSSANTVADPEIRSLIQQLLIEICDGEPYDYDRHGYMIVVEAGDTVEALEEVTGCHILHDPTNSTRFGDPSFVPSFEFVAQHLGCYEMEFLFDDSGAGVGIFVPKAEGIDRELQRLCAQYAEAMSEAIVTQP